MSEPHFEAQSPDKALPESDADSADAAWSEEMLEWAIASSTCGGLPRKEDEPVKSADSADAKASDNEDKPACP